MRDADEHDEQQTPDTAAVLDQGERLLADSAQLLRRLDVLIERSRRRVERVDGDPTAAPG